MKKDNKRRLEDSTDCSDSKKKRVDAVTANVEGRLYTVARDTLTQPVAGDEFHLLRICFDAELAEKHTFETDTNGHPFFDRSSRLFEVILQFLRSGCSEDVAIETMCLSTQKDELARELRYYGMTNMAAFVENESVVPEKKAGHFVYRKVLETQEVGQFPFFPSVIAGHVKSLNEVTEWLIANNQTPVSEKQPSQLSLLNVSDYAMPTAPTPPPPRYKLSYKKSVSTKSENIFKMAISSFPVAGDISAQARNCNYFEVCVEVEWMYWSKKKSRASLENLFVIGMIDQDEEDAKLYSNRLGDCAPAKRDIYWTKFAKALKKHSCGYMATTSNTNNGEVPVYVVEHTRNYKSVPDANVPGRGCPLHVNTTKSARFGVQFIPKTKKLYFYTDGHLEPYFIEIESNSTNYSYMCMVGGEVSATVVKNTDPPKAAQDLWDESNV